MAIEKNIEAKNSDQLKISVIHRLKLHFKQIETIYTFYQTSSWKKLKHLTWLFAYCVELRTSAFQHSYDLKQVSCFKRLLFSEVHLVQLWLADWFILSGIWVKWYQKLQNCMLTTQKQKLVQLQKQMCAHHITEVYTTIKQLNDDITIF